ncbi:Biotin carboxylase / Biotin carboxyl carrier protein [Alteromonas sp. 38]|uniref:acetyl/propionyl/methylcrotonyl-CoA carboxylase subunit alpha n=1 Tax=unclassified Alteromonas TaxID=2614992 RepID=UPI0012F3F8FC|nr:MULTISPECIES: acetyl/propionyl/methylcrotonyl-CoA carboxylase subunit alpha [unclassified Alteromonas]CAD5274295.1 Biotin carboxylase / Biotin carboxyl carrier protein [Alteromonas sp. 154]VXB60180.1 Biotin carboxylase / Biotin carboxyl carrier protein [Alteromonas sp. 38]
MFDKILIANRGEIACRVIKTARKMGIRTVAVYSDADRHALHVEMADEAVHIGHAPSRESYLVIEKVIAAAKQTGAQAIHPGYGFLSENADFCRACQDNNLIFIGPPVDAIEAMGSKSAAKDIMGKADVPLVPGYHGADQDPELLRASSEQMGYPVLLKAAAGGGGKGMRQVWQAEDFDEALSAAKREAMNGFGDDTMLVEKYLTEPRHVEIQVFCDQHHNAVYLFERDCSLQRRHQKVIEEAPAPGMSDSLRQQMGEAAVRAAQAIDYQGAGTVEFLLDHDGRFYFMEMNTRLQVEHPVTEMITGKDLVEWQLRVAAGQTLPCRQEQLTIHGHAFEARVYAEDPDKDFLPVTGQLLLLRPPASNDNVRVDTGVRQGDEVSVYYDPMIAKLIVWDEDRETALQRLRQSLRDYQIAGMKTNLPFLYKLASVDAFAQADLDTRFIERHEQEIFKPDEHDKTKHLLLATLFMLLKESQYHTGDAHSSDDNRSPWLETHDWRMNLVHCQHITLLIDGEPHHLKVQATTRDTLDGYRIQYDGQDYFVAGERFEHELIAHIEGHRQTATVSLQDNKGMLFTQQGRLEFTLPEVDLGMEGASQSQGALAAPMNGTVVELAVKAGEKVSKDSLLLVMEAMKMEHSIRAPADGYVEEFYFTAGDLVDGGTQLMSFNTEAETAL